MTHGLTEITVVGDDDTGLIAEVTTLLFERGINIEDLDQAVRDGVFRMTMHVDTADMFTTQAKIREDLDALGDDLGDEKGTPDEGDLLEILGEYDTDLVVLARYMRILSPDVVFRYESRIINVHPSLLPSFPGAAAYMQAIEEGVRIAGVTAHYVTTDLDQGPIITQRAFNVPDDANEEELQRIGQPLEAEAFIEAIKLHLQDEVTVHRGRTKLRDAENVEAQLGAPEDLDDLNPDRPIDGLGEFVAGDEAESEPAADD